MKISELGERIAYLQEEFGDSDAEIPDALEPGWRIKVTGAEWDHDRETVVLTTD